MSLPAELLQEILFYAGYDSLLKLSQTNQFLRQTISDEHFTEALIDEEWDDEYYRGYSGGILPCYGCFRLLPTWTHFGVPQIRFGRGCEEMQQRLCIRCCGRPAKK